MTEFLMRRLVRDYDNTEDSRVRRRVGSVSGTVGIVCNLLLFALKLLAGLLAGSVSVMADALNNLSDASASIVTLLGFRLAGKPADEHHPFGHARFEYLTGLAVSVLVMVIGVELGKTSVEKILNPDAVQLSGVTLTVLLASIGIKLWLWRFNTRLGSHIGSQTLLATAADSRNDCVATAAVLAAALVEGLLDIRVDGNMGLAVAVFILRSGWDLAKQTVSPLLGENADPELRGRILEDIRSHPKVLGYHDLMVHDYGPGQRYASLHVEMDSREDPMTCHDIIDEMERQCLRRHNVRLVIHYDPVVTDDPERNRLKEHCASALRLWDQRLELHDFRMVQGRQHMNLVFDVALPTDLRGREEAIRSHVENGLNTGGDRVYHVKITYDIPANGTEG